MFACTVAETEHALLESDATLFQFNNVVLMQLVKGVKARFKYWQGKGRLSSQQEKTKWTSDLCEALIDVGKKSDYGQVGLAKSVSI